MHAVRILGRIDHVDDRIFINALGQRQLHDKSGASRVIVKFTHGLGNLAETGIGRQFLLDRGDTHLLAIGMLAGHVLHRAGILPHQQRAQSRHHALRLELVHTFGEIGFDRGSNLLAVDFRGHPYPSILFGAFYRNDRLSLEQIRIISFVHLNEEGTPWGFGLHDSRNSPQPA